MVRAAPAAPRAAALPLALFALLLLPSHLGEAAGGGSPATLVQSSPTPAGPLLRPTAWPHESVIHCNIFLVLANDRASSLNNACATTVWAHARPFTVPPSLNPSVPQAQPTLSIHHARSPALWLTCPDWSPTPCWFLDLQLRHEPRYINTNESFNLGHVGHPMDNTAPNHSRAACSHTCSHLCTLCVNTPLTGGWLSRVLYAPRSVQWGSTQAIQSKISAASN